MSDFKINNGCLEKYTGMKPDVVIPDGVISINDNVFYNHIEITSVVIPDSVTSIGESAFRSCINLTDITIPDSVVNIGNRAFSQCHKLADERGFVIFNNILFACYNTEPEISVPEGITEIGERAFSSLRNLSDIKIPDSVTSINDYGFDACSNLTEIVIPDTVTTIGNHIFIGCENLRKIYIKNITLIPVYYKHMALAGLSDIYSECTGEQKKAYSAYVESNIRVALKDIKILEFLLENNFISEDKIDSFIEAAGYQQNVEAVALLLEYKVKQRINQEGTGIWLIF